MKMKIISFAALLVFIYFRMFGNEDGYNTVKGIPLVNTKKQVLGTVVIKKHRPRTRRWATQEEIDEIGRKDPTLGNLFLPGNPANPVDKYFKQ